MTQQVTTVSDEQLSHMIEDSPTPVLVDFWAPWCGPCKMIAPVLDELATEMGDQVSIVKINVDEHSDHAARFGVRGIPTLLMFKKGELVDTHVGAASKTQLQAFIEKNS